MFLIIGIVQADFPIVLAIIRPVLSHLDEQEQMHAAVKQLLQLLAAASSLIAAPNVAPLAGSRQTRHTPTISETSVLHSALQI